MMMKIAGQRGAVKKGLVAIIGAALLLAGGGYGYYRYQHSHVHAENEGQKELYTCGMHPWILSDKPGDCPICGMKLTKLEGALPKDAQNPKPAVKPKAAEEDFFTEIGGKPTAKTAPGVGKLLFYRNPMNPEITSKVPAKDEMGMEYVPVYEEAAPDAAGTGDRAAVRLDDEMIRRIGVKTAIAVLGSASSPARSVGRVVADETRVRVVNTKIGGWIEKLHVNYMGQLVEKGQPLITLYSPELLATQEEYLRARAAAARIGTSNDREFNDRANGLVELAKRRLELFDVPQSALAELEAGGKALRTVTLKAPISGYVTGKEVFEGSKVEAGMVLFTLTDLSRVWVEADLYEYEGSKVKVGSEATLTLPNAPQNPLAGRVTFISPVVDTDSRTIRARFEFSNPGMVLKPGMFADIALSVGGAEGILVPDSALMDTGTSRIVFVERQAGVFEPRAVELILRAEGKAVLASGVAAGERVVVAANFLIDSESRLRATIEKMTAKTRADKSAPDGGGGK